MLLPGTCWYSTTSSSTTPPSDRMDIFQSHAAPWNLLRARFCRETGSPPPGTRFQNHLRALRSFFTTVHLEETKAVVTPVLISSGPVHGVDTITWVRPAPCGGLYATMQVGPAVGEHAGPTQHRKTKWKRSPGNGRR
ncbi:unnamed protein product [Lota lota]